MFRTFMKTDAGLTFGRTSEKSCPGNAAMIPRERASFKMRPRKAHLDEGCGNGRLRQFLPITLGSSFECDFV